MKNDYGLMVNRYQHCENCGSGKHLEIHHVIYRRSIRRPFLNVIQNLSRVCRVCHQAGTVSTPEYKRRHWHKRDLEGYKMTEWNEVLPLKVKEYWGE